MTPSAATTYALNAVAEVTLQGVAAAAVNYRGRPALRVVEDDGPPTDAHALAVIAGSDFQDGVIETAIAGAPRAGAAEGMRGFVGVAFRVQPGAAAFECFYLRPTNGRANDQLRRNHATQYISHPDYPWYRLREETPGVYESYTDLVPGAWTPLKIVVAGARAELYVNGAGQPCLVVNDLKLGEAARGQIGLWIGAGTEAYFSEVVVR